MVFFSYRSVFPGREVTAGPFPLREDEDEQEGAHQEQEGIEEVGDDLKRGQGEPQLTGRRQSHQHLGPVGEDPLEDTGEGVQQ